MVGNMSQSIYHKLLDYFIGLTESDIF